jgi:aryl-alcohol dehydrogenase-like predicted oxidoreductase
VLGTNVFGWTADEKASFAVLDAFVAEGFQCIDTADVYAKWAPGNSGGESETVIGNWLASRGRRDKVIIATKVGAEFAPDRKGLSADYIVRAVEASLRRLQTDYIDLYQSHHEDPNTPLEETMAAFGRLIEQGKVRAIGASNHSAATLRRALAASDALKAARYQVLQIEASLYERSKFAGELADLAAKEKLGVIAYYPLAGGFLTGKYRSEADLDKSKRGTGISKYFNDRGFRILAAMDRVASCNSAKLAQIAVAWLLCQPGITAPISSATSVAQLTDLIEGTRLKLSPDDLELLDNASA